MSKSVNRALNEVLVNLFNNIMTIEAKAIITEEFKDISNNDMHIIEAIGIYHPIMVSTAAKSLSVTLGTMNVAMNNLEKKGYIIRERSQEDKRVVLVSLTEKGRKAFFHHRDFHKKMIKTIVYSMETEERDTLLKCLNNLENFFKDYK